MHEVRGAASHPDTSVTWLGLVLFTGIALGLLLRVSAGPPPDPGPKPVLEPPARAVDPSARYDIRDQMHHMAHAERYGEWLNRQSEIRAYPERRRRAAFGLVLVAGVVASNVAYLWCVRRVPIRIVSHELRIGRTAVPWSSVRSARFAPSGCRVELTDGRVLLDGYLLEEDAGALQRAAETATALGDHRSGPVPAELGALLGRTAPRTEDARAPRDTPRA